MKVYDRDPTGSATAGPGRSQEAQKADRSSGSSSLAGSNSADRVELSTGLASLSRAIAAEGSDRASRVQQLNAQYQSGSYQPDSLAISHGMIAEALNVGGK